VPGAKGPRITYPVAQVADGKSPDSGARFLKYLFRPEAQAVFRKYGFVPVTNTEETPL